MLAKLADKMAADAEAEETPDTEQDAEENNHIPAGYTYLGQFIDHDLTFDPNSSLQKQNDLEALVDFRTPRFDLDCVYGRGPNDQPYMYRDDNFFLFGRRLTGSTFDKNVRDLPRNNPDPLGSNRANARALIGDPRNDENVIVSQLQGIFMRFHNHVAAEMIRKNPRVEFKDIQQMVRWHYQWVILHDFLPRILDLEVLKQVLPGYKRHRPFDDCFKPNLEIFKWRKSAFIPIEFTAAAYRFGHSMIRPIYRLNSTLPGRFHIFSANPLDSLVGFREFPDVWAIDWRLYFPIEKRPILGPDRVQPAYKMDTSIVNPLKTLPNPVVAPKPEVERNLPESVRSMVQRKIDQLNEADRKLLVGASVQGFEFDSTSVAAAVKIDAADVEEQLERLERVHAFVRFIEEKELPDRSMTLRYRFVHVLYQNALYGSFLVVVYSAAAPQYISSLTFLSS